MFIIGLCDTGRNAGTQVLNFDIFSLSPVRGAYSKSQVFIVNQPRILTNKHEVTKSGSRQFCVGKKSS